MGQNRPLGQPPKVYMRGFLAINELSRHKNPPLNSPLSHFKLLPLFYYLQIKKDALKSKYRDFSTILRLVSYVFLLVLRWKLTRGAGASPRIACINKAENPHKRTEEQRFWRYNGRSKLTSEVPCFEYG